VLHLNYFLDLTLINQHMKDVLMVKEFIKTEAIKI